MTDSKDQHHRQIKPQNMEKTNSSTPERAAKAAVSMQRYVSPTPGEFPITAMGAPKQDGATFSLSTMKLYKGIGINMIQRKLENSNPGHDDDENNKKNPIGYIFNKAYYALLDQLISDAEKAGMRVMLRISMASLTEPDGDKNKFDYWLVEWEKIVNRYYNSQALGGWMLLDEPTGPEIPRMYEAKEKILQFDEWQHIVFTSLHSFRFFCEKDESSLDPIVTKFEWSDAYKEYIKKIKNEFGPAVWNITSYALSDWVSMSVHSGFFQTLDMFRRLSFMTNRPFWG